MDNDVFGTDYCIGFGTAITRSVQAINDLRTPIGSHERIGVIELFGRNSGETSLIASYLASVDRAIISRGALRRREAGRHDPAGTSWTTPATTPS